MRALLALTLTALTAAVAAGCGGGGGKTGLPTGSEPVELDPSTFTTAIDNPYWPMTPGTTWVYRETDADGGVREVRVTVTNRTRVVLGIETRVVHDVVTEGGAPVEDTYDWYAQDADGNLWYFGEDTKEYENGKVSSTKGSWEAGVGGAQAGIALPGTPTVGLAYRQEFLAGEAEDSARVLSVDERVQVAAGSFAEVLMTRDVTGLDPAVDEHKFYARGVGPVLELGLSGGSDRAELLRVERAR